MIKALIGTWKTQRHNHVRIRNLYPCFIFFHVHGNHIVTFAGPQRYFREFRHCRYGTVRCDAGQGLILQVAEILGLDVRGSDIQIIGRCRKQESSDAPWKREFLVGRSSWRRPSQSVKLLIGCHLRLCLPWLLLSVSLPHGQLWAQSCKERFKVQTSDLKL